MLPPEYSVDVFMYMRETRVFRRAIAAAGGALLLSACAFTDEVLNEQINRAFRQQD